jgi:hypothetical protein
MEQHSCGRTKKILSSSLHVFANRLYRQTTAFEATVQHTFNSRDVCWSPIQAQLLLLGTLLGYMIIGRKRYYIPILWAIVDCHPWMDLVSDDDTSIS